MSRRESTEGKTLKGLLDLDLEDLGGVTVAASKLSVCKSLLSRYTYGAQNSAIHMPLDLFASLVKAIADRQAGTFHALRYLADIAGFCLVAKTQSEKVEQSPLDHFCDITKASTGLMNELADAARDNLYDETERARLDRIASELETQIAELRASLKAAPLTLVAMRSA